MHFAGVEPNQNVLPSISRNVDAFFLFIIIIMFMGKSSCVKLFRLHHSKAPLEYLFFFFLLSSFQP